MVVLWERKELIIFFLQMLLVGHLPGTHTSCSNAHVSSGEQGISCGRVKGQPGIWRQHLCFSIIMRPLCKEGLMAATCLQLRDQILSFSVRDTRKADVCVVKQVGFAPLGDPFGKANLMRSRIAGDVSVRAKFPDSGDPLCSEDDGREEHFKDREQTTGWTATVDARGTPLLIETLRGAVSLDDEGEESDLPIEADEEFEYGSWAPSLSSVPHDRVDDSLNTVCEEEIHHWRDGEMESELGRLEMAVCDGTYDGRVPTLLQMNRAMHLCCKAVYKGLGQAGLSKGLRVLNLMWMCGVTPNGRSFDLLLDAAIGSAAQGNKDALYVALTIIFNMCDLGLAPRVILVNQLIKQVLKATANRESDYALALEVVDAVSAAGVRLDIYSYNSLMAATAMQPKSGSQQTLDLLARMRRHKIKPDIVTYNAFLHTCAKGCHIHGEWLVRRAWRLLEVLRSRPRGLHLSVISYNALVHSCARAAAAAPAHKMHNSLHVSWPANAEEKLAAVYARGRLLEDMMMLVGMMKQDNIEPDLRSFSTLLYGLARGIDRMVLDALAVPVHTEASNFAAANVTGQYATYTRSLRHPTAHAASYKRQRALAHGKAHRANSAADDMRQRIIAQVEGLCEAGEEVLLGMPRLYKMHPETSNYRAVLDMYRSAARLDVGQRDWPAAALWLLSMMRETAQGKAVPESTYTDVLEICAAVSERRRHASMQPSYTHTPVSRANADAKHGTGRGGSNSAGGAHEAQANMRFQCIMDIVMQVVECLMRDRVPLSPAAVGYIFFAARREGSEKAAECTFAFFLSLQPHLRSKQVYTSMMATLASVGRTADVLWLLEHAKKHECVQPDEIMYGVCLQALRNDRTKLLEFRALLLATAEQRAASAASCVINEGATHDMGAPPSQLQRQEALTDEQLSTLLLKVEKALSRWGVWAKPWGGAARSSPASTSTASTTLPSSSSSSSSSTSLSSLRATRLRRLFIQRAAAAAAPPQGVLTPSEKAAGQAPPSANAERSEHRRDRGRQTERQGECRWFAAPPPAAQPQKVSQSKQRNRGVLSVASAAAAAAAQAQREVLSAEALMNRRRSSEEWAQAQAQRDTQRRAEQQQQRARLAAADQTRATRLAAAQQRAAQRTEGEGHHQHKSAYVSIPFSGRSNARQDLNGKGRAEAERAEREPFGGRSNERQDLNAADKLRVTCLAADNKSDAERAEREAFGGRVGGRSNERLHLSYLNGNSRAESGQDTADTIGTPDTDTADTIGTPDTTRAGKAKQEREDRMSGEQGRGGRGLGVTGDSENEAIPLHLQKLRRRNARVSPSLSRSVCTKTSSSSATTAVNGGGEGGKGGHAFGALIPSERTAAVTSSSSRIHTSTFSTASTTPISIAEPEKAAHLEGLRRRVPRHLRARLDVSNGALDVAGSSVEMFISTTSPPPRSERAERCGGQWIGAINMSKAEDQTS